MRLPRPRFTVRRLMVAVAALAISLGFGLPAAMTWGEAGDHTHTYISQGRPGAATFSSGPVHLPLLARYRRRLFRVDREDCGRRLGNIEEACSLAHPEVETPFGLRETAAQAEAIDRMAGDTFEQWQRHPPGPSIRMDGKRADSR